MEGEVKKCQIGIILSDTLSFFFRWLLYFFNSSQIYHRTVINIIAVSRSSFSYIHFHVERINVSIQHVLLLAASIRIRRLKIHNLSYRPRLTHSFNSSRKQFIYLQIYIFHTTWDCSQYIPWKNWKGTFYAYKLWTVLDITH